MDRLGFIVSANLFRCAPPCPRHPEAPRPSLLDMQGAHTHLGALPCPGRAQVATWGQLAREGGIRDTSVCVRARAGAGARGCACTRQPARPPLPAPAEPACPAAVCSRLRGCGGPGACTGMRYMWCLHAFVLPPDREHGACGLVGGMCPPCTWGGCHGVHTGWGAQSPRSGCQFPPVPQSACLNQLHKPLGGGVGSA